jgi:starch synthase
MYVVLYRWRIKPEFERSHREGWRQVTEAIRRTWGTAGSRLHRADDGSWIAYAVWPDEATFRRSREVAPAPTPAELQLMLEALDGPSEIMFRMVVTDDLLGSLPEAAQVQVVPYDARWPEQYATEAPKVAAALGQQCVAIEHIGGTSVPGLEARPVVEILAGLSELWLSGAALQALSALGYVHSREASLSDRLCFHKRGAESFDLILVRHGGALWHENLAGGVPRAIHISHLTYECFPFSKYGGLGDAVGSLPVYLQRAGTDNTVITPFFYDGMRVGSFPVERSLSIEVGYLGRSEPVEVLVTRHRGVRFVFIKSERYFRRAGIYHDPSGKPYADLVERSVFFSKAGLQAMEALELPMDRLLIHDWFGTGAVSYLRERPVPGLKTCFVIHNFQFHGTVKDSDLAGLEPCVREDLQALTEAGLHRSIGCNAVLRADQVITVSPSYRDELLYGSPPLHVGTEVFRRIPPERLHGFLNGIDTEVWSPRWQAQSVADILAEKAVARRELLQKHSGLDPRKPVALMMNRLARQKGIFLFINETGGFDEENAGLLSRLFEELHLVVCGNLEGVNESIDASFKALAARFPESVVYLNRYTEERAHELLAASDMYLIPSVFEPCGLTQMYAMRYGSVPVAHATGGLKDSILDWQEASATGTGFLFHEFTLAGLERALQRAVQVFQRPPAWGSLMRQILEANHSWELRAAAYHQLLLKEW